MKDLIKCIVPVFALAVLLAGVPAYADAILCPDETPAGTSPATLPDCTQVLITTCYCHAGPNAGDNQDLELEIVDNNSSGVSGVTISTNGEACVADSTDLAATARIADVVERQGQFNKDGKNSTPSPKGHTDVDCDGDDCDFSNDCPDTVLSGESCANGR